MLLQRGPLGVMIQYLPFSLTTSTPLMVALSRPFPDGTNERSAKRQGRSFVTSTSDWFLLLTQCREAAGDAGRAERSIIFRSEQISNAKRNAAHPRAWEMVASTYAA